MRRAIRLAAFAAAASALIAIAPAEAKTCKEVISVKSRSTAQTSDAGREQRARDRAILNWTKRAREAYGWSYRFWARAEEKQVECGGTAKFKQCTVSAKPCSLL